MSDLIQMLLSLSLGGGVLALLLLAIRLVFGRKLPSVFYYYAWLLVLLRFILPVPGVVRLERPVTPLPTPEAQVEHHRTAAPRPAVAFDPPQQTFPVIHEEPDVLEAPDTMAEQTPIVPETELPRIPVKAEKPRFSISVSQLVTVLWAAGAAACALYFTVSYLRFSRALNRTLRPSREREQTLFQKLGGPEKLKLRRSGGVGTPMQLGLVDARLVLPEREYTDEMLVNILRHELTHYTRHDIAYKWFTVAVCAVHWFNPVLWIARREIDRQCELSCDERLLSTMTPHQKQSYGQTLLELATDRAVPRRVVATSFATQKRNLKERLEQIMTYKNKGRSALALLLCAALLLGGCAAAMGPAGESKEPAVSAALTEATEATTMSVSLTEEEGPVQTPEGIRVSTVDELLEAIAPNTTILLAADTFDLTQASTYPEVNPADAKNYSMDNYPASVSAGAYCSWVCNWCDGYELVISGVENLTIRADGGETVSLLTEPRYSNVLYFSGCSGIRLEGLTIGHSKGAGSCVGAVLCYERTDDVTVQNCRLYGCGTWGVQADSCQGMQVQNCDIYDCSQGAVYLTKCYDAWMNSCDIYQINAYDSLFLLNQCREIAVTNSNVRRNMSNRMVSCDAATQGVYFLAVQLSDNAFFNGLYASEQNPIVFDGCHLNESNRIMGQMASEGTGTVQAVNMQGRQLSDDDLWHMELGDFESWEAVKPDMPDRPEPSEDGIIHVRSVDELIAAIAPDTTIYIEPGTYDLTTAADYGGMGGAYYTWDEEYDGYTLVIQYAANLKILAEDPAKVTLETVPRYADVLRFENCFNITLKGFTAGHTVEPGSCMGDVLGFVTTQGVRVENCSLFGCGVYGIHAEYTSLLAVENTELHHCEYAPALLWGCTNVTFNQCNIHDNGDNTIDVSSCERVTQDGVKLA